MTTPHAAHLLSPFQNEALKLLLQRMESYLAWPANRNNPERLGFSQDDFNQLSLLQKYPTYANAQKLDDILIPIQDRLLRKIEEKGQRNREIVREIQHLVSNVRPLFADVASVEIPEADKLVASSQMISKQAEDIGYMVSLIANVINPPKAQIYYPQFGKR